MRRLFVAIELSTMLIGVVSGQANAWGGSAQGHAQREDAWVELADRSGPGRDTPLHWTCVDPRTRRIGIHDPFAARGIPSTLLIPFPRCAPTQVQDMPQQPGRLPKDCAPWPVLTERDHGEPASVSPGRGPLYERHRQRRLPCALP
jgi:hypothetical protein